jgi:gliding motility-associated-like protein
MQECYQTKLTKKCCFFLPEETTFYGLAKKRLTRPWALMRCFFCLFFSSSLLSLNATHLVGGDITYTCLGNNAYEVTLTVYRDCGPNSMAPFDNTGVITVYYGDNTYVNYYHAPRLPIVRLPNTVNNPCLQVPPNVCTEKAEYRITINLPPDARGYTLLHQRCCRNSTINNIPLPGTWGNTFVTTIPPNDSCNSGPSFQNDPPVVLCMMDTLSHNFGAIDINGDSLYYELCVPLHGGGNNTNTTNNFQTPLPIPGAPPPYTPIPFLPAFNISNPLPATPNIQIDPVTGVMTGVPNAIGQYVFAVCATEYRNGVPLSTLRRDFQFNVIPCNSNVVAQIMPQDPMQRCLGRTIQFFENSINATIFSWDFGDPASGAANQSNDPNPVHTFSDTGTFIITLIANPGFPCADTTTAVYVIRDPVDATFTYNGSPCLDNPNLRFAINFPHRVDSTAVFEWDFGPDATPRFVSTMEATGIQFSRPGVHTVFLRLSYDGCDAQHAVNVELFERPTFEIDPGPLAGCVPFEFRPRDLSNANSPIQYTWNLEPGVTSNAAEPVHTFTTLGTAQISVRLRTLDGCEDSATFFYELNLYRSPTSRFTVTPERVSYYEAWVEVENIGAQPGEVITTYMGDGYSYGMLNFNHQYRDTGWFEVTQVVMTPDGCSDSAIIPVYVAPEVLLFVPNAFTPNGDGVNDVFSWSATGMRRFEMVIFSRWGDEVFRTDDPGAYWNGGYRNRGDIMPEGVYTWVVYARGIDDKAYSKTGTVLLSR